MSFCIEITEKYGRIDQLRLCKKSGLKSIKIESIKIEDWITSNLSKTFNNIYEIGIKIYQKHLKLHKN